MHEAPIRSCKVYFVDDDRAVIHSSVQWLGLSGFNVQAFADPKLLLRTIKANEFCVVVSDIRMPDLDGMSLMKHIHMRDAQVPFILITGHGDIPLAVEAMKQGAFEFITKPFSPEGLLESIQKAQVYRQQYLEKLQHKDAVEIVRDDAQVAGEQSEECSVSGSSGSLNSMVENFEKSVIEAAFKKHNGDVTCVLDELEIPRRTLNAKMKKHNISRRHYRFR